MKEFSISKVGFLNAPRGLYTVGLIIGILRYARKICKELERSRNRIARGTAAAFGHASRSDCDVTRCLETRAIKS